jgi:lactoylglutathione lyase
MPLQYVGIRVTDLDRSLKFYVGGLGLAERKRGTMSHGGVWVNLVDPRSKARLELNYYPPGTPFARPYSPGDGLDHIGFDVDDARVVVERLRKSGAKVAVEPWLEQDRYWIGFVEDPDGLWVEIQSLVGPGKGATSAPSGSS